MNFKVVTKYPVAVDSPDHIAATNINYGGAAVDNSKNPAFNAKLRQLVGFPYYLMDIGCSGGGFVEDCVNEGNFAIGLEGSDHGFKSKRHAWGTIPNNLFTCDVTKHFNVLEDGISTNWPKMAQFDVITAWEFIEHIAEKDLHQLLINISNHMAYKSLVIMSVSTTEGPPYHQTIKPKEWWLDLFDKHGWYNCPDLVNYFGDDWIRGPKQNAEGSFHLILRQKYIGDKLNAKT